MDQYESMIMGIESSGYKLSVGLYNLLLKRSGEGLRDNWFKEIEIHHLHSVCVSI